MRAPVVHAVLILVQVLFAALAIAVKGALRELAPPVLVLLRVAGAALAFALILRGWRRASGTAGTTGGSRCTRSWASSLTRWLMVLYIIFVPTAATYWLNLWMLQRAESSVVAIYIYVQPLVTVLIAPAVLGERLGAEAVLGGALIFAGIALVVWSRRRRTASEAVRETEV